MYIYKFIFFKIKYLDDMFTIDDILHDRHKQSENQEKIKKNGCVMQCLLQKEEMVRFFVISLKRMSKL